MDKNTSLQDTFSSNFILKGFTAILIGAYIYSGAYIMKTVLDGFLIDENPMGMLSVEIMEVLFIGIGFLVLLFSMLAVYFSGKRNAKKAAQKLWNPQTKNTFKKYIIGVVLIFAMLILLMTLGFINYITPAFLISYGVLLFLLKNKARKDMLVLVTLCILLGTLCFLIPSYWYPALTIISIVHVTYGVMVKN